jgi:hypothetical protein
MIWVRERRTFGKRHSVLYFVDTATHHVLLMSDLPPLEIPHTWIRDSPRSRSSDVGHLAGVVPIRQGPRLRNDGLQLWLLRARDRNGARPLDPQIRDFVIRQIALARRPRDWSSEMLQQFELLTAGGRLGLG